MSNEEKAVSPVNPGSGPGQAPVSRVFVIIQHLWVPAFAGMTIIILIF